MDWNPSFATQLGQATQMVRSGHLAEATQAIQQALAGSAGTAPFSMGTATAVAPTAAPQPRRRLTAWRHHSDTAGATDIEDAVVIEPGLPRKPRSPPDSKPQHTASQTIRAALAALSSLNGAPLANPLTQRTAPTPTPSQAKAPRPTVPELPGSFGPVALAHAGVSHSYRLYVSPGVAIGEPMPLVLMLHGCTQNPDDFATGTGMNQAATAAGALVVYPAQLRHANPQACWTWFTPENQQRGRGEPDLLVAMLRDVMARHPVDPRRVYVAGLSAGGAMAALLAREYPELFAAVGVHSGLQAGAAHNIMGALSAMKSGAKGVPQAAPLARPRDVPALIVFHGDADPTVSPHNGSQLVEAAVQQLGANAVRSVTQQGQSAAGERYTRTLFHAPGARVPGDATDVRVEQWTLHGAGHAWSGGAAGGSHTNPRGVSATKEMLRFFLEHPKAAGLPD